MNVAYFVIIVGGLCDTYKKVFNKNENLKN